MKKHEINHTIKKSKQHSETKNRINSIPLANTGTTSENTGGLTKCAHWLPGLSYTLTGVTELKLFLNMSNL